ncbi:E3 ubiquitin-protein ligase TRIP12 isoform X2 [Agrilus planipennis]|uniref:E3 ubiquitin-protein ligase n=1 Tax=Agrilus planipennis TaxID=224129 RepID=A0A7F5R3H5_AGRPL|nr:E3 ubiquitin-protein ligase TRIP12 isoform X2 [Agrilus planipennis]
MADPANTPAVDSTNRRKRVLQSQPRFEAKRLRTASQTSWNSTDVKVTKKVKSKSKIGLASKSNQSLSSVEGPSTSRSSQSDISSNQDTPQKRRHSLIPVPTPKFRNCSSSIPGNIADVKSLNNREEKTSHTFPKLKKDWKTKSATSDHPDRRKCPEENANAVPSTFGRGGSNNKIANSKHSKLSSSSSKQKVKSSSWKFRKITEATLQDINSYPDNINENPAGSSSSSAKLRSTFRKSYKDKYSLSKHNYTTSKLDNEKSSPSEVKTQNSPYSPTVEQPSCSGFNSSFPRTHKYPLRSQGRLSDPCPVVGYIRKSTEKKKSRELKALGASSSQTNNNALVDSEPSRLTRSGAVLRRSTRSSKGHSSTTGSCASSSGASGSGSSSRRASRQHKVGSAAPAPLAPPASLAAAAMAADHPDLPNNALNASEEPASPQEATQALANSGGPSGPGADSESDDSEVGRLQALLEARGLPPHLFGALGPRMQHLLHRSMGANSSATKAQQLLQGLQATGDEGQQLQAVIEMCQMLVMGNEDTLTGFPIKQVVPALISLLQVEHNFDMMNHACRALTYMMEALPRSSAVVVDAVPVFLEKLQVIQCMDVAEQSLTALDMLSRRHSKAILQARGVQACLMYLDFFSINAQRNALSITANCCPNLTSDEFQFVADSLSLLAGRLTQQDKKSVESVCLAFSRLVDSFQSDPSRLQEIASTELLTNLQQLLVVTPPIISTPTFITVLRMMSIMCASCPDLALTLLKQNIAETLLYLLTGSGDVNQDEIELVPRQPQELYEITALIGELMPKLPSDGIFTVDAYLERPSAVMKELPAWQWRDDRGTWHQYTMADSRTIEAAHVGGDDEQINEDTGTSRPVQRRYAPVGIVGAGSTHPNTVNNTSINSSSASDLDSLHSIPPGSSGGRDARVACLREEHGLAASFIRSLFSVLYEVYSSSAGPAVRCKCLKALLRMVYYASPELLKEVLKNQIVSSHIAGMMASSDLRIVVGSLQMADILMTKLPDVFGVHFRREGVMHQIRQLTNPEIPLGASPPKSANPNMSSSYLMASTDSQPGPSNTSTNNSLVSQTANGSATLTPTGTPTSNNSSYSSATPDGHRVRSPSPSHVRLSDVLKRRKAQKRSSGGNRSKSRHEDLPLSPSLMQDLFSKATSLGSSTTSNSSRPRYSSSGSKASSFLSSLNPARWGRNMNSSSHDRSFNKDSFNSCIGKSSSNSNLTAGNREKTRGWIRDQAGKFLETYSANEVSGPPHPAMNVLACLTSSIQKLQTIACQDALQELREILMESDISPFEVNHSGLIKALLHFLADTNGCLYRDQRLRTFLHVFAGTPLAQDAVDIPELNPVWMGALVAKLNGCVSQLEQFPVKVHDLPAGSGIGRSGTSALKFFNTHQLKCNLQRHPDCTNLKQWKGGTVKIDPLALVQAIERYLVARGYGRIRDKDSAADSDDGDSDDDIDDTLAAVVISQSGSKHKLQFLIGNQVLPYNMTVYQAIRQYSNNGNDQSETDTDNETPLGNAGIWVQTHTIYYRPLREEVNLTAKSSNSSASSHSSRKGKGSGGKSTSKRRVDDLWNEGMVPQTLSPLTPFLVTSLPESVSIQDASLEVLCLLRILNALNLYWNCLYPALEYTPILPSSEFLNSKIAAKASRQLQDPLVIMTGNLPNWLQQIASVCPFLFPFETRQLLFYATSFDRDRALQRLLDMSPELSSADSQERVTPRLDRRKRTISRDDILKQAEQVIQDLASSKALLEIQYENEVGTGLGPTLEFYALVSRELQRTELDLWHAPDSVGQEYVHAAAGLFPLPLGKGAKMGQISKSKSKFRFLGKFMAKAVMDSRMLDLPFSLTFYRWLLGQEQSLTLADLYHVSPDIHRTLRKMQEIVRKRNTILENPDASSAEKNAQLEQLDFDGCPIEDLGIDFILPGHNVELMKNGRNTHVTIHNLHQYANLVTYWFLIEGVYRQMEAFREGFETVFSLQNLRMFQPEELEAVFCGSPRDSMSGWDVKTLMECCRPDHGFTADSRAIHFLFEVLSSYNKDEQRRFVQFITGSPRLPVGGFKALSPPLTVVRKTLEPNQNADDFLPSVMTCVNYLKLPDYSSIEVMREKLRLAASEGQHSFHLS